MGFSTQEYWSGLPCRPPGDHPDPGIKLVSPVAPVLQADSFTSEPPWRPHSGILFSLKKNWKSDTCQMKEDAHTHPKYCMSPLPWGTWSIQIHRQKVEQWLPRLTETGNYCLMSTEQDEKSSGDGWWWWLYNNLKVLDTTKLHFKRIIMANIMCILQINNTVHCNRNCAIHWRVSSSSP